MLKFKKQYLYIIAAPLALTLVACDNTKDVSNTITVTKSDSTTMQFTTAPVGVVPAGQ